MGCAAGVMTSPRHSNADKEPTKSDSQYRQMDTVSTDKWQSNLLSLFNCRLSSLECTYAAAGRQSSSPGKSNVDNSEADSLGSARRLLRCPRRTTLQRTTAAWKRRLNLMGRFFPSSHHSRCHPQDTESWLEEDVLQACRGSELSLCRDGLQDTKTLVGG